MDKYLDEDIRGEVEMLLDIKMNTPEVTAGKRIERLNAYLDKAMAEIEDVLAALPNEDPLPWDTLNRLFLELLQ